ncbi:FAD-dependent oxidoreductase [Halarchaeum sp. CBA1220]|uniref:FAD-dependent oxidoreductase n=1 Tax=Halarchaeum sp. CBA1220 TaxID=1853682 RepID=UPI000F3AA2D0|nr:FAD-dependent oxidoreductase [Halarchaeum sp. CBA1220]QLC34064.1 FAD-dependent oxidoreductase [Halarchaeum sp. CBA1220]
MSDSTSRPSVVVVGGGVAGLNAALYTARAGFETTVVNADESILRRNGHLENVPGFPAGVNSRTFLDLLEEQATEAGADLVTGEVVSLRRSEGRFVADTADGEAYAGDYAVAATKSNPGYLDGFDLDVDQHGSKTYVRADDRGRTDVAGLYVAGRLAAEPHQAAIVAGHGAKVGLSVVEDSDVPYYHDWVAPEGYFTGRGRDVPPGVEEIDEGERAERERDAMARMREAFDERHPEEPTMHPSVADDDE